MTYLLTVDFKIIFCLFRQKMYACAAKITFILFKLHHPFVISKIKKAEIDELKKSIELLKKNNEINERVLKTFRNGLQKIELKPEYENKELRDSHQQLILTIHQRIDEGEKRGKDNDNLITEVQDTIIRVHQAKKIIVQPERNFWHYYFIIVQLRKRKFRKMVEIHSSFNRKFF